MSETKLRALVVDDEAVARCAVMLALANEDFHCDPAHDGEYALQMFKESAYDLVVTDLRMPNKHGHALAVELLASSDSPPVIVAHSSIDDPRLTKDLMIRGVDDIVYKPTNYAAFAAKMKGLVIRRRQQRNAKGPKPRGENAAVKHGPSQDAVPETFASLGIEEFDERLGDMAHILPVSDVAIELLNRVRGEDCDARELADLISRDAILTAEMLRLSNNGFYNRSGRKITALHEAIARVGTKRIGEIAVAVSALESLTEVVLPWLDKDLARMRSLAACMAADRVLKCYGVGKHREGILFSSLMYPLRHVVVGTGYSGVYENLIAESRRTGQSLRSLEGDVFPRLPAAATVQVLSRWGLPGDLSFPLLHADLSFHALVALTEPVRTSVKLVKTAIALGELAVGKWMPWDTVEFPPAAILRELQIDSPGEILREIRQDLDSLRSPDHHESDASCSTEMVTSRQVMYCPVNSKTFDFVPHVLASLGCSVRAVASQERYGRSEPMIVNCLNVSSASFATHCEEADRKPWLTLCDQDPPDLLRQSDRMLRLPASYLAISRALQRLIEEGPEDSGGDAEN